MYEIEFFEDKNGHSEIADLLRTLKEQGKSNKESRINLNKIIAYMDLLEEKGTRIGEPMTKHLDGEIWELRPLKNRILYAYYRENKFIMLHYFIKKRRKLLKKKLIKQNVILKFF